MPLTRSAGRRLARAALVLAAVPLLSACSLDDVPNFGFPKPASPQAQRILDLWKGSSIAGLIVAAAVYVLILWACVRYRRRGDRIPAQIQYNLPVEVLYTVVPTLIVLFLFYFTDRTETFVNKVERKPDCTVNVVGFQWAWQFNYTDCGTATGLSVTGRPARQVGTAGQPGDTPVLMLPADRVVRFVETSPDVIHSFWIPDLLFKRDVIPGRRNTWQVDSIAAGTYKGRCAELCGEYHSRMLFQVKVMPQGQFDTAIGAAKADTTSGKYAILGSSS